MLEREVIFILRQFRLNSLKDDLNLNDSGKTSLVTRYCANVFPERLFSTIGAEFKIKRVELAGVVYKMQVKSARSPSTN